MFKFLKFPKKVEPNITIQSSRLDPNGGIEISLDWNDEFVEYLKTNGYTGTSEETIVQKWLTRLYQDQLSKLNDSNTNTFE